MVRFVLPAVYQQCTYISPPRITVENRPAGIASTPHFDPLRRAAGDGGVGVG